MSFCKNCGNKLDEDAKFCSNCGAPSPAAAPEKSEKDDSDFKTVKRDAGPYGAYRLEDLPEGFVIDDRYEVKAKVGQGGFGAVYRVFDQSLSIDKAIKIIPDGIAADREAMTELRKETRTLVSLTHDAIVRVYDVHDTGSIKYIDMEYVNGRPLNELKLDCQGGVLPEEEVRLLGLKIAEALSYAHGKGVIHKDVKPQNVMVMDKSDVKIMDFGISESLRTSMSRLANSSSSGTLVYMSPEQVKGEEVGPEADIYSFGAMLYELLSGHPPFWKGAIEYQIFNEKPKPLEGVSEEMNELVLKCLEKDYRKRLNSFKELQTMMRGALNKEKPSYSIPPIQAEYHSLNIIKRRGMILVEGGTFLMGSIDGDDDEKPIHSVTVSSFYISKYQVTQGLWREVMGRKTQGTNFGAGSNYPVYMVSWYDAVAFCNKLSEIDGLTPVYRISENNVTCNWSERGYRLPTEAEWEYAARGGNQSKGYIYAGSDKNEDVAWYGRNSIDGTHPVGSKRANEIGIFDMSGNVWEWCWDWYGGYSGDSRHDPRGISAANTRVYRGGAWNRSIYNCRTTTREGAGPSVKVLNIGFRLARLAVN